MNFGSFSSDRKHNEMENPKLSYYGLMKQKSWSGFFILILILNEVLKNTYVSLISKAWKRS